jgi:hypothetical protein
MKIKTSELSGPALDWAVAQAEGLIYHGSAWSNYFTNWAQGGPIIEREIDSVFRVRSPGEVVWEATAQGDSECSGVGPTLLIAAMRCFVASKLGDEVDVPEEFK